MSLFFFIGVILPNGEIQLQCLKRCDFGGLQSSEVTKKGVQIAEFVSTVFIMKPKIQKED